jgi:serine/threonine-protein kinase
VLRVNFLSDPQACRRLLREARAAALLEHPNICHIYEISETNEHCFIVMQYIVGTTAGRSDRPRVALAFQQLLITRRNLPTGLAEAHRNGIIHRDIKTPERDRRREGPGEDPGFRSRESLSRPRPRLTPHTD